MPSELATGLLSRRSWIIIVVFSAGLSLACWGFPLLIVLTQVLVGIPLLFFCFEYAFRLRKRLGALWILLLAPLLRQFVWVMLPSILFSIISGNERFHYLLQPTGVSDVTAGMLIMTLANHSLYLVLVVFLLKLRLKLDLSRCRSSKGMACLGLLMMATWLYFRLQEQSSELVFTHVESLGSSVAYLWGYAGFVLLLTAYLPKPGEHLRGRRIGFWMATALVFALSVVSVGQRMYVIYPFVIVMSLILMLKADQLNLRRLLVGGFAGTATVLVGFACVDGIRRISRASGHLPAISQLPQLLLFGFSDLRWVVQEIAFRCSQMLFVAQLAYSRPDLFPPFGWTKVVLQFADSLISGRVFSFSRFFGVDLSGDNPSKWLAIFFGEGPASSFTFQPEAAFYLAGGPVGVVLGYISLGVLTCFWVYALIRWQKNQAITLSVVFGCLFVNLVLAELFSTVVNTMAWNMIVLLIMLKSFERITSLFSGVPKVQLSNLRHQGSSG